MRLAMKMLSKLQRLVGEKLSKDKPALAEKPEVADEARMKSASHIFVLQALEAVRKLELDGGTFICASPDFECYFKKKYMPLFEDKSAYINVAFDKQGGISDVCGLLPRLQHEKERGKTEDEKRTLSKMPNCLLSQAIAELSRADESKRSKTGNVVHRGQTASSGYQNSNLVFDPNASDRPLEGGEKEWLDSMHASLIDREYKILLQLLRYSIVADDFRETIEHFLVTRKELEPGSCSAIINAFKYLARDFQFDEQTISVARIGYSLEQAFDLEPKEIFSIIVELFFCLGYEKEIEGYTTGFSESI